MDNIRIGDPILSQDGTEIVAYWACNITQPKGSEFFEWSWVGLIRQPQRFGAPKPHIPLKMNKGAVFCAFNRGPIRVWQVEALYGEIEYAFDDPALFTREPRNDPEKEAAAIERTLAGEAGRIIDPAAADYLRGYAANLRRIGAR